MTKSTSSVDKIRRIFYILKPFYCKISSNMLSFFKLYIFETFLIILEAFLDIVFFFVKICQKINRRFTSIPGFLKYVDLRPLSRTFSRARGQSYTRGHKYVDLRPFSQKFSRAWGHSFARRHKHVG